MTELKHSRVSQDEYITGLINKELMHSQIYETSPIRKIEHILKNKDSYYEEYIKEITKEYKKCFRRTEHILRNNYGIQKHTFKVGEKK